MLKNIMVQSGAIVEPLHVVEPPGLNLALRTSQRAFTTMVRVLVIARLRTISVDLATSQSSRSAAARHRKTTLPFFSTFRTFLVKVCT